MPPLEHLEANQLIFKVVKFFFVFGSEVSVDEELLDDEEDAMSDHMPLSHLEALEWVF